MLAFELMVTTASFVIHTIRVKFLASHLDVRTVHNENVDHLIRIMGHIATLVLVARLVCHNASIALLTLTCLQGMQQPVVSSIPTHEMVPPSSIFL